ncbi:hypothetical protein, partial [Pseudomonas sp. S11A4]|uniref:hypothetical protein n=1 Tax=Pseudomonas sp. S11A4 TaxID=1476791 RepID=UPI00215CCC02
WISARSANPTIPALSAQWRAAGKGSTVQPGSWFMPLAAARPSGGDFGAQRDLIIRSGSLLRVLTSAFD